MDILDIGSQTKQKHDPDDMQADSTTLTSNNPGMLATHYNEKFNTDRGNVSPVAVELASSSSSGEFPQRASLSQPQEVVRRVKEAEDNSAQGEAEIEEFSAEEESELRRKFRRVTILGGNRSINLQLIEPFRDVVRHGGYIDAKCAVVTLSLDHLPPRTVQDYDVILENIFLYVLSTLEQLIVESFVLVIVSTHSSNDSTSHAQHVDLPGLGWLRSHHSLVDRRLRKSLRLAVVLHASMRFRTLMMVANFIVSSKLKKKLRYVRTAEELERYVPLANVYLPDEFKLKSDSEARKQSNSTIQAPPDTRNDVDEMAGPSPPVRLTGQQKTDRRTTVLF